MTAVVNDGCDSALQPKTIEGIERKQNLQVV